MIVEVKIEVVAAAPKGQAGVLVMKRAIMISGTCVDTRWDRVCESPMSLLSIGTQWALPAEDAD